jgi:hypothetical protein
MGDPDVLLRRAHEAGYRFPPGFTGFTATLETDSGGGRVTVVDRSNVHVEGDPGAEIAWAKSEIASIVSHRWPSSYDEGDGRWAKRLDGERVEILDDPFDSTYRVRDAHVSEVHRTVGESRFVISVGERVTTDDGRHLPTHFTVFHWATATGRLIRADAYIDAYVQVDGVYLPERRQVTSATDDGLVTRVLTLTDHVVSGMVGRDA